MNFEDILLVQDPAHALGTILGQTDAKSNKVISQNISDDAGPCNKNIAVFGAPGSGKTFSFALPFCDQALSVVNPLSSQIRAVKYSKKLRINSVTRDMSSGA